MNNLTFGDGRRQYYETIAGGGGAGEGFRGSSGVQTHMTNSRLTDPEILEQRFPVQLEQFGFRRGSGGAGRWKGGDGLLREIRFLQPMTAALLSGSRTVAPSDWLAVTPAPQQRSDHPRRWHGGSAWRLRADVPSVLAIVC